MAKIIDLGLEDEEELCLVGKALASPTRIRILKLLNNEALIIGEIAKRLDIPPSSAAMHVKILEQADLIMMEEQPGTRGSTKLCNRKKDIVHVSLVGKSRKVIETVTTAMPIGSYTECKPLPTCGIAGKDGIIGVEDQHVAFYRPERLEAQLLWSAGGYVEYKFPNEVPRKAQPIKLALSLEVCSEAPGFREDWKSDITVWINGQDCGFFRSPGDLGGRRGRYTPVGWENGSTQYGLLTTWEVGPEGCFIAGRKVSDTKICDLRLMDRASVVVRIGNKEDAKYIGGFNLFGKGYGDYEQDIMLSIEFE